MTQTILYSFADASNDLFGYWPSILFPFLIVAGIVIFQIKKMAFSLATFVAFFSIFPALTPAVTQALGYSYFTMLNYDLQNDLVLKTAAVLLISLFAFFLILGAMLPNRILHLEYRERLFIGQTPLGILLVIVWLIAFLFLESGTILIRTYGDVKLADQAANSSLVNQFINACVAIFVCYLGSRSRLRLVCFFYIAMIVLLLLFSRRTLALSMMILMMYSFGGTKLSFKNSLLLLLAIFLLIFIGEARSIGIINYIQGAAPEEAIRNFFSLPGGASNLFTGSMGVIHMVGQDALSFPETIPIILWPAGIYEASVYSSFGYDYNGGMHIANILYWNFGLLGVCLGGLIIGWLTTRVHIISSRVTKDLGGTFPAMLGFAYILTLPNLIWYHPIGLIKLSFAVTFGFGGLAVIKRATKPFQSVGSSIGIIGARS